MKITYLLIGCLVLAGLAFVADAAVSTVVSTADVYVEYNYKPDYQNPSDPNHGD